MKQPVVMAFGARFFAALLPLGFVGLMPLGFVGLMPLGFVGLMPFGQLACRPKLAAFGDTDKLVAAQKVWCAAVAKHETAPGETFMHLEACERATPSASSEFLGRITGCYLRARDAEGTESPTDLGLLVAQCTDEALMNAEPGDVSASEVILARCRRMSRCEKVDVEACRAGFGSLSGTQRAALTAMYNLRAQHQIAECLEDSDCTKDEDHARVACYEKLHDSRVWLPHLR